MLLVISWISILITVVSLSSSLVVQNEVAAHKSHKSALMINASESSITLSFGVYTSVGIPSFANSTGFTKGALEFH